MDKRNFEDVVKGVESAEKDVDKVLDAARLQRHEGPGTRLTAEQKMELLMMLRAAARFLGLCGCSLVGRTERREMS